MEILIMPNEKILAIIGEQPVFANKDYRFMKYCLVRDVPEGKLIFNGLTRTLIILSDEELQEIGNINKYPFLYKNYFLVPEDYNEMKVVDEVREKFKKPIDDLYLNNPQSFTVLTTTKCNARCFYCYELHHKNKKHMTKETAIKIADYIQAYAPSDGRAINICFFGGEPLYNQESIDIIVNRLIEYGRPFTTTIVSNGYLFTTELVNKAKNIWNLVDAQITIDGTEEIYNKTKNYIYKVGGSPYKKVLNNIAMLLNRGISVSIRLNIDNYNAEDLKKLVIELHNRFGNHQGLSIYSWPIFEDENFSRTPEEHAAVFDRVKELDDILINHGYNSGLYPKSEIAYCQCMADDGNSVLIDPEGNMGTCEHFTNSHFFGNINNPVEKNFNELNIWREYNPPLDICADCPIYPSCIRPTHCEEMGKCDIYFKEWRINRHLNGLLFPYMQTRNNMTQLPRRLSENVQ